MAALEVLLRTTGMDRPLVWRPDPELGWVHIPGARQRWTEEGDGWVEINSLGMRDRERAIDKPPGVFRIGIFGDSMTEAVQVTPDQTFSQLLERHLRNGGWNVEVLNFGVNGYGPLQEYLYYQRVEDRFDLDLVVQAIFLDNDVADLHPALAVGRGSAPFVVPESDNPWQVDYSRAASSTRHYEQQPIYTIRHHSALYRLFSAVHWRRQQQDASNRRTGNEVPLRYRLYDAERTPEWDEAWSALERIIQVFARATEAQGTRYVLLSVPAGQLVNEAAWAAVLEQFPAMQLRRWELSAPESRLMQIAQRNGTSLITATERYKSRAKHDTLFFGDVGHFTPSGHALLAEILAHALSPQSFTDGLRGLDARDNLSPPVKTRR